MKSIKLFLVAIFILVLMIYLRIFVMVDDGSVSGVFIFIPLATIVLFIMGLSSWNK